MELYVQYKDYNWMMAFTEKLLERICIAVNGSVVDFQVQGLAHLADFLFALPVQVITRFFLDGLQDGQAAIGALKLMVFPSTTLSVLPFTAMQMRSSNFSVNASSSCNPYIVHKVPCK